MRIRKITALAFAIMLLMTGCSVGASAQAEGLIISEVVTSNSNSLIDPVLGKPDWVELFNPGSEPVSLLDYVLSESNSSKFEFPDVTLGAGEYMIVYCCQAVAGLDSDVLCTNFKLSKSGTVLTLSYKNSLVHRLEVPALETDISFGIREDGTYAYFARPTPAAPNTTESYDDIKDLESDKTVPLVINEVLPNNPAESEAYAWAEIYNAGSEAVKLSDYYITEDLSDLTKARLPEVTLGAGEYFVVRFSGSEGSDEVPFRISKSENMIAVSNNFGSIIDSISWQVGILAGISAGRDEEKNTIYYADPTPGAQNGSDLLTGPTLSEGISDVRINEMLLNNTFSLIDEDSERPQWVELYNSSGKTVSLAGYALSDRENDPMRWRLPNIEMAADSYLVIFVSGKDRATGDNLHTNFKLGSSDDKLCLTNLYGGTIQAVQLPSKRQNNISYGFSDGQWLYFPEPTPASLNNTAGFAEIALIETQPSGLRINEVASVSAAKSGKSDWIELHNTLSQEINLSGYYLSDSRSNLTKWPLANATIKSGGFKVIDGYNDGKEKKELGISLAGETLYLSSPDGNLIDEFNTSVLRPGLSCGLDSDNATVIFEKPTPGAQNGASVLQGYCAAPFFSVSGGYQTNPISLTMTTSTTGAAIYYTLDGSTPTKSSKRYEGPLNVSSTKTVRAIAVASGMLRSEETVATYLFVKKHKLPVVCLSMTQSDLNWVFRSTKRDDKRERAGFVEYYEADGSLGTRFPAGFRIAGAGTRTYPQKSINLYLRGGYGRSSVTYPFFEGYDITTFKSLSLRNMGQDVNSRIKDAYFSMAVNGMNIDNMQAKFAVVYINGKYWGLYEFKENQNEDYFASKYGIDRDKVVMIRGNTNPVDKGSNAGIKKLYTLAQKTANDKIFEQYTSLADSDYFMDYIIAETFFHCYDTYNQKFAHTTDNSMKWRPMYYDFDLSFSSASVNNIGFFFQDKYVRGDPKFSGGPERVTNLSLYNGFSRNPEWRQQYVKRYAEVLNTVLTNEKLLKRFDEMVDSMRDEMPRTIKRWGRPSSVSKWEKEIAALRKRIESRRKYVIKHLKSYFKLSNADMKELFPND